MSTNEFNGVPSDVMADLQAVADHVASGKPLDPEVARRVRARADKAGAELLEKRGVQEVGVQIIREMRGELPDA
jgi:hypothetical protein